MQLRDMVRVSLFAALMAALGLFPRLDIPLAGGVPITLQTLGVMMAGVFLGARLALPVSRCFCSSCSWARRCWLVAVADWAFCSPRRPAI